MTLILLLVVAEHTPISLLVIAEHPGALLLVVAVHHPGEGEALAALPGHAADGQLPPHALDHRRSELLGRRVTALQHGKCSLQLSLIAAV